MTFARHASLPSPPRLIRARAAEADHDAVRNARAAITVAGHAADVADCCELLAMLGLDASDGRARRMG
jgi:hypothetical protein